VADRPPLTRRQERILDTIRSSVRDRGYPPSLRELTAAVGISSSSTAAEQLRIIQARGYIKITPNTPRGIMVLDPIAPTPEQAGIIQSLSRHRYGTDGYEVPNTCPGCKTPNLHTTVGLTDVASTYEVCTCRDDDHTYDHLVEQLWHRTCLTGVPLDDPGCGHCGRPRGGDHGYTGDAAYHRRCAREVYGDTYQEH
jgi:hypothetical protein